MSVCRFYEEIVDTGDVSGISEIVSDEYTEVMDGTRYPIEIEGAVSHILGVRRTYPDLLLTVDRQIPEGEWIGIAPTGRKVNFNGVSVDRVVDGKIVEHGGAVNMLGPLLEIGAIRVVGNE